MSLRTESHVISNNYHVVLPTVQGHLEELQYVESLECEGPLPHNQLSCTTVLVRTFRRNGLRNIHLSYTKPLSCITTCSQQDRFLKEVSGVKLTCRYWSGEGWPVMFDDRADG